MIAIFDLDDTLIINNDYGETMYENTYMIEKLNKYRDSGYEIWILTNRQKEAYEQATLMDLQDAGIEFDELYMRDRDVPPSVSPWDFKVKWLSDNLNPMDMAVFYDDMEATREAVVEDLIEHGEYQFLEVHGVE